MTTSDPFTPARSALADGQPREAIILIDRGVRGTGASPPLDVVVRASEQLGLPDLRAAAERAAAEPLDAEALFGLGYQLIEVGLHATAVPPLRAALELAPSAPAILAELAVALQQGERYAEAVAVLQNHPQAVRGDFICTYLLGHNSLLTGALELAREALAQLPPVPPGAPVDHAALRALFVQAMARAEAAARITTLDDMDLRGWHFIVNGGLLTMLATENDEMNGRWALLYDQYHTCRAGLDRLLAVLATWKLQPQRVLSFPDRGSRALALAAGRLLGLPVEPLSPDPGAGLIVAYDLSAVEPALLQGLAVKRSNQVLFAHAANWTRPSNVAPDIVSLLYQTLSEPWAPQMYATFDEGSDRPNVHDIAADPAPPEELAEHIVAADPQYASVDAGDDVQGVVAFARAVTDVAAGTRGEGRRDRCWNTAAVGSNRFV